MEEGTLYIEPGAEERARRIARFRSDMVQAEDEARKRELYESFITEIRGGIEKSDALFKKVIATQSFVQNYRAGMKYGADALLAAIDFGDSSGFDTKEAEKLAVDTMVKLCAPYAYEQNVDKIVVQKVDNAEDEVREIYAKEYDRLVEKIRGSEPDYAPAAIQRERATQLPNRKESEKKTEGNGFLAFLRGLFSKKESGDPQ